MKIHQRNEHRNTQQQTQEYTHCWADCKANPSKIIIIAPDQSLSVKIPVAMGQWG